MLIYKWTIILFCVKISFSHMEEDGRIIEYDNFDKFKNSLNKSYLHTYDELRSRSAFEENRAAIRQHNDLFNKGKSSFRLRTNIMADMNHTFFISTINKDGEYIDVVIPPLTDEILIVIYETVYDTAPAFTYKFDNWLPSNGMPFK